MDFIDLMISAPGETVCLTMDDDRRIGTHHEILKMGAGQTLGSLMDGKAGKKQHILEVYEILQHSPCTFCILPS
jgi:hypothetical protein